MAEQEKKDGGKEGGKEEGCIWELSWRKMIEEKVRFQNIKEKRLKDKKGKK